MRVAGSSTRRRGDDNTEDGGKGEGRAQRLTDV
jgi:hypothetical protein